MYYYILLWLLPVLSIIIFKKDTEKCFFTSFFDFISNVVQIWGTFCIPQTYIQKYMKMQAISNQNGMEALVWKYMLLQNNQY